MKKVLVTGGCGYIGVVLTKKLIGLGYKVRVVDKLYFGTNGIEKLENVELINADIRFVDPRWFDDVFAVIHLASLSNDPTAEFDEGANYSINYVAARNLAMAAKEKGVKIFSYASTAAVYGLFNEFLATEESQLYPLSHYAETKLMADEYIQSLADDQFATVVLRQSTLFGSSPRMRWDLVVNTFVMQALRDGFLKVDGTGESWRPLIHINDIADAHIQCIDEMNIHKVNGQVFNIVNENMKIMELANLVKQSLKKLDINIEIRTTEFPDKRSYMIDGSKIRDLIGYSPKYSVQDGIEEIVDKLNSDELFKDFDNPKYYNMKWLECLVECEKYFTYHAKAL